jgi:glycosyltransferase involved in cell wall biosynthesis
MQVLIIPSWYFPKGSDAISGRMFHAHAAGIIAAGIDATVFYPQYSLRGPLFKRVVFETEDSVPTYRVLRWWPPKANKLLYRQWLMQCAKDLQHYIQLHGKPDIIHAQSYQAAGVAAVIRAKTGIPFIYTERLSSFLTGDIPRFHLPFFKSIFENASLVTCVSPGLASALQQHVKKEIRVVPNFVDTGVFTNDTAVTKNNVFTWIAVGEPAHTKGLDTLFHAFAMLKQKLSGVNMQLMIADEVPERKKLEALASTLGIASAITWKGLVSQQQLSTLFNQSHAFVSASRIETFGKTTIEAQACGLPVVATKTAGSTFIVKNEWQGELAEIDNAASLQQAMGKVYSGFSGYAAKDIRENIIRRFGKEVIVKQWIEIYNQVSR